MFEENLARIRTHRNDIDRYRRLLRTELSHLERDFIRKRMEDAQTSLDALVAATFPMTFQQAIDHGAAMSAAFETC